jgi:hypothetical protein
MQSEGFPDYTFNSVPVYRITSFFLYTDTQPVVLHTVCRKDQRKTLTMQAFSLAIDTIKLPVFSQQTYFGKSKSFFHQAESCLRPLARRRLITACPARVLMRNRNPWVRLRLILLG